MTEPLGRYVARQAITVGREAGDAFSGRPSASVLASIPLTGGGFPSIAFLGEHLLVTGHSDGVVRHWDITTRQKFWEVRLPGAVTALRVVGSAYVIGVAFGERVGALSIESGDLLCQFHGGRLLDVALAPGGHHLLCASTDRTVREHHLVNRDTRTYGHHDRVVHGVSYSPDGTMFASGSGNEIHMWRASGEKLPSIKAKGVGVGLVRWSPGGQYIAAVCGRYFIHVWQVDYPRVAPVILQHTGEVTSMDWSPNGRTLASAAFDRTIRLWDGLTGEEHLRFDADRGHHRNITWSPNGSVLATGSKGGYVHLWNVIAEAGESTANRPLAAPSFATASLPSALTQLHRLQIHPPLSLLLDVLKLVGGDAPSAQLARLRDNDSVRGLAGLRWPNAARVGLAALLLHGLPVDEWRPPAETDPRQLRDELHKALLVGRPVDPQAPVISSEALAEAAGRVDERMLALLEVVGAKAVARDPGLPLRLLPRAAQIRALGKTQRQLLGLRTPLGTSGRSTGRGSDGERGGVDVRGDLRALLPTQLVLPPTVLRYRHLRGELLYRAKIGEEPPKLRPAVIVLDISPPSVGPVESVTRLAAYILGKTLLEASLRAVLVTSGGPEIVRELQRVEDLVDVWTVRSHRLAHAKRTLKLADAMRGQIGGDGLEPLIVVLSHTWFGADESVGDLAGLRGLFVQYPKFEGKPPLASRCERWESIRPADATRLSKVLGELIR